MTTRPFHHGSLREVLLTQAEVMLRHGGVEGLSLRELAREAGVSHGAPRSHFIDKQALLDSLAEQGFDRLTRKVSAALAGEGTFAERFRHVGHAYVNFGVEDAALMELMFAAKMNRPSGALQEAAASLFQVLDDALADGSPVDPSLEDDRYRFKLLFAATVQGIATLIAAGRVSPSQKDVLVDDAIDLLLGSRLGALVLPDS